MTIYIVYNDTTECANALDDKSLEKMIKEIAQTLCTVHYVFLHFHKEVNDYKIPLTYKLNKPNYSFFRWVNWAHECVANYHFLAKLGTQYAKELIYRYGGDNTTSKVPSYKYRMAISWAKNPTGLAWRI